MVFTLLLLQNPVVMKMVKSMQKTKILCLVILANMAIWLAFNRPAPQVSSWTDKIEGVSFSPYHKGQNPMEKMYPFPDQIDGDLKMIRGVTRSVRSYSSLDGFENIPGMAVRYGLSVTAGAWLDQDKEKNEREIRSLIRNARTYTTTVPRVIVGNESVLRGDLTVKELIEYIRRVREQVPCPVSTAEPWDVWINNPELARNVDYIAIHILPYWEKIPLEHSLKWVLDRYRQVQQAYPDKHVLLAEVGWPSHGERRGPAKPSTVNEALFLRAFFNVAAENKIDYFIMEAFDQPWKIDLEGVMGAHWGLFDKDRNLKIALEGPVKEVSPLPLPLVCSLLLAIIPLSMYLRKKQNQPFNGQLFFAMVIQLSISAVVWIASTPWIHELLPTETLIWGLLLPLQAGLLVVVLINGFEMAEMLWPAGLKRRFYPLVPEEGRDFPKVSLHLAICNEPPDMVAKTLDSLNQLDYPNYEVLVLDNNTLDADVWEPVRDYCQQLGAKFRFFHLGKWPGFKAGALNFGLSVTAPDAEIVGIVDSDYIVRPDWLKSLIPYFDKPKIGFVQAPQDHREWQGSFFKEMLNFEYHGFFQIGMIHRNERDAIIQHGTMTLIRKQALLDVGRWAEWCICEDSELGLRLMNAGFESVYVSESFGHGLTPDSFAGYKRQRFRWAYGAVQIIRRHWRTFLPWNPQSGLTDGQKYHFATGWFPWFGDAFNVIITWATLLWVAGVIVLPRYFGQPLYILLLPALGVFIFRLIHFFWLYKARVGCTLKQRTGAAIAGMALSHTIGKAMISGLISSDKPFLRTPKCENQRAVIKGVLMAWEEMLIFLTFCLSSAAIIGRHGTDNPEILLWVGVMLIQSLPYGAALLTSMINVIPALAPRGAFQQIFAPGRMGLRFFANRSEIG